MPPGDLGVLPVERAAEDAGWVTTGEEVAAGRHVRGAGMEVQDSHGVRIFSDLVPAAFTDSDADRTALLELEQAAARHPDFGFLGQLGATLHVLARKA